MKLAKLYGLRMASEEPIIHSDTLYCALLDTLFQYCRKKNEREKYNELALSSAFPFVDMQEKTYYFIPFSAITAQILGAFKGDLSKKAKKAWLYSADVFKKPLSSTENLLDYSFEALEERGEVRDIYHSEVRPHVSIDRTKGTAREGVLFVKKVFSFDKKSGLYFVFPDGFERNIKEALDMLKNIGILGDKSMGLGSFEEYEIVNDAEELLNHSSSGNCALMFSLYRPTESEMEKIARYSKKIAYKIVQRAGFFETKSPNRFTYKKPVQHYFAEGSVFWFPASTKLRVCGNNVKISDNFLAPKAIALHFEVR